MRFGPASLNRRLMTGAAVFIALALVIAAIVIGFVLHRFIQGQVDQRLDTQIGFLQSTLTVGDGGAVTLAGNADGPPFDRPLRGWYWEVTGPANRLRSRSLEGFDLVVPADHPPPRHEHPAPADGPGPNARPVHFRIQHVMVRDAQLVLVATAPRMAVIGPLREAMATLALSLAVLGLALVLAIVIQVRLGLRPLEQLRQAVADVRAGRAQRLPSEQPLEILPLVTGLNALLEQNATNLERARRHVANLAHGLKTPLATLAIALAERGHDASGDLQALVLLMERRIRHHLGRARAAALSGPTRVQTAIAPRIADLGQVLGKIHAEKRIALTVEVPADLAVACEPQDFDEMAGNLLDNAFRWARGSVAVRVFETDGRSISLVIEDDGPGLRSDQIPLVLRPGERVDETAPGFGFGLPITRELAELYGGDLSLDCSPLGGLLVALRLPRAA
jgi:signal transduction histidine kinase